ncbi:putative O-glycosylation ligase, exosortase A system-associated [Reyranella sp.]|uniref:putative O-glycosylation ligase, exosortase A system-associated n=1 Tax=Reyranella sp. TaxID=1929291 RepID=UPI003D0D3A92
MQALFIFGCWASLIGLGFVAPFTAALAYIWVDLFRPQDVAPTLGQFIPFSMVTAVMAVGAYLALDRRDPPRLGLLTGLLVAWAVWITLTTTWSLFPYVAWWKWDWAFKTIMFTTLLPFVFRSRIQMEAALLVILCCIASNVLPFAFKSVFGGGGGYGRAFGLVPVNGGWGGEGSTLSTYAFACLPLVTYLQRHSLLAPGRGWLRWVYLAAPGFAVIGAFGSFARAALIACFVWAALAWWQSRRKLQTAVVMVAAAAAVVPLMGDAWLARISTTFEPAKEQSANTRLLIWAWTVDFANQHPAGGGFMAELASRIEWRNEAGEEIVEERRAFHSIYFEVLGEQGWIGLAIFFTIIVVFFVDMQRIRRQVRNRPDLEWLGDLARALSHGMLIFMAGAAFVSIAFQPLQYYLLALAVSASAALHRAAAQPAPAAAEARITPALPAGWRRRAAQAKLPR